MAVRSVGNPREGCHWLSLASCTHVQNLIGRIVFDLIWLDNGSSRDLDAVSYTHLPIARKLVELAKYYGFDGYFINHETTGNLVEPLGPKLRDFLLYTKEYAKSLNYPCLLYTSRCV